MDLPENLSDVKIDVLNPPTHWVGNRCYRILTPGMGSQTVGSAYVEEDAYPDCIYHDEDECEQDIDIPFQRLQNGKLTTSFSVASSYLPFIIGSKGATKNRLENETRTVIKIPAKGQTGDVVVMGRNIRSLREAKVRIDLLVDQVRRRQPSTHFVSIPCNEQFVQETFGNFREEVLNKCGCNRGVVRSIFQKPQKLHMTICVMVLADQVERQRATEVFSQAHQQIMTSLVCSSPIRVRLQGVEYMNDDPGEVDVLYAGVKDEGGRLQKLAEQMVDTLVAAGIASREYERVKCHVTLMNSLFRDDEGEEGEREGGKRNRQTFDARNILKEFKDYDFGEFDLSYVHLSVRHSTAHDGYYFASCRRSLVHNEDI